MSPADSTTQWVNQSVAADALLPLHTIAARGLIPLVRVYTVLGLIGHCFCVLVAKSLEELASWLDSVKCNLTASTKYSLGQPPSFFVENSTYEYRS